MRKPHPRPRALTIAAAAPLTAGGAAHDAAATGHELREQSAVGGGASFAGPVARNDDPTMLLSNSAAKSGLPGIQGTVVGSAIVPRMVATSDTATRNAAHGGDRGLDAPVPALHGTVALGADWHVRRSVRLPRGLASLTDPRPDSINLFRATLDAKHCASIDNAAAQPRLAF